MLKRMLAVAACAGLAVPVMGQTVTFRVIERTGQNTGSDTLLELAVQAQVTGGNLGGFSFDIVFTGEAEANGTLGRARISSADHTYFTGAPWAANSGVGTGGVASTFSYLAGINANHNGLINVSGGTFTNNPAVNEIGLVGGAATGSSLLNTPDIDTDGDGIPDLAPSNGGVSTNNEVSPLEPTTAGPYFGNGQFIDIYRFRYTIVSTTDRTFTINIVNPSAQTFSQLLYNNGAWFAQNSTLNSANISTTGLTITIGNGSSGTCCSAAGACTLVLQASCIAPSVWTIGGTCTPNPCPQQGTCCAATGACSFVAQSACTGDNTWTVGGSCSPNSCPQPGTCCGAGGACSFVLQAVCGGGGWTAGGACSPNPCLQGTVEFRIVEESATTNSAVTAAPPAQGTPLTTANTRGHFAVQARVVGGQALGGFSFDIVISGEPDTSGDLAKLRISNADGTYYTGAAATNPGIGSGGLAKSFTYLAGINSNFNGQINTSSGTFTNNPAQQEIGLITAVAVGAPLLATPNLDPNSEGNPATWLEYGSGLPPANLSTASLDPAIGATYFAQGQFIDVYRFRYTSTVFTGRTLSITLANIHAQSFSDLLYTYGQWGAQSTAIPLSSILVTPFVVSVDNLGPCCDQFGGCAFVHQPECAVGNIWSFGGVCSPNPCPQFGSCCTATGICSFGLASTCAPFSAWTQGFACSPNPCPQPAVEFRIVERQGQSNIPNPLGPAATTDHILNFAVQARVVNGSPTAFLGDFHFDIVAPGEPDSNGSLAKLLISNFDGTYNANPAQSTSASVGRGGLAAIYAYPAYLSQSRNGLINTSGGTFTNTPGSQEIGWIAGSPTGGSLLLLADMLGTGDPDTYPGFGTTAPIDPALAAEYLGADGNFVDVYRFRYTVSDVSARRTVTFALANLTAQIGAGLALTNDQWGPVQSNAVVSSTGVSIQIDGLGACCNLLGGCSATGSGVCSGSSYQPGVACSPNPCPPGGTCCAPTGACAVVPQSLCTDAWSLAGTCAPNPCPQPGTCCAATGACTLVLQTGCAEAWGMGPTCVPNPCPQPGTCCATTGACSFGFASACPIDAVWTLGGACTPNPCPQPGTCCASTGACTFTLESACTQAWTLGGACTPNPCPQPGLCCTTAGPCTIVL